MIDYLIIGSGLAGIGFSEIDSPFSYGQVLQTGHVETAVLLEKYKDYLVRNNLFVEESFDYELLEVLPGGVRYKDSEARHIIFAEGFGMHANP